MVAPDVGGSFGAKGSLYPEEMLVAVLARKLARPVKWTSDRMEDLTATSQAFDSPGLLLLIFVLAVGSAGFHELGHASACKYGGATPGGMGMGIYMVWPAFYTDVTDAYRLPRGARSRVRGGRGQRSLGRINPRVAPHEHEVGHAERRVEVDAPAKEGPQAPPLRCPAAGMTSVAMIPPYSIV